MSMTNDERREVAERLRELSECVYDEENTYELAADAVGGVLNTAYLFERLADLIEPGPQCPYYSDERHWCGIHDIELERTCHDVSFDSREFACSLCGCHIDVLGIESEPTMWLGGSPIEPSFCPNCGAKVVAE